MFVQLDIKYNNHSYTLVLNATLKMSLQMVKSCNNLIWSVKGVSTTQNIINYSSEWLKVKLGMHAPKLIDFKFKTRELVKSSKLNLDIIYDLYVRLIFFRSVN